MLLLAQYEVVLSYQILSPGIDALSVLWKTELTNGILNMLRCTKLYGISTRNQNTTIVITGRDTSTVLCSSMIKIYIWTSSEHVCGFQGSIGTQPSV